MPVMRQTIAALLGAAACLETADALGPTIAPRFSAPLVNAPDLRQRVGRLPLGAAKPGPWTSNGTLYYDAASRRFRFYKTQKIPFLGEDAVLRQENIGWEDKSLETNNDQCSEASTFFDSPLETQGFDGLFGWVRNAVHVGHDTFQNRTCDLWTEVASNKSLCLDGDAPVYVQATMNFTGHPYTSRMSFGPISRDVDEKDLKVPDACVNPSQVCGEDRVEKMRIYLLHPRGEFNISDQDVADPKGDAVYICSDRLWQAENYKLATVYEISVLQKFGQYLNCNLYEPSICFGSNRFYVGREAPISMGIGASQCDDTEGWLERIGVWYSMPAGGRCVDPRQQIGVDCTWRVEKRIKTFELSCLFDEAHGFLKQCDTTEPPFEDITAKYLKAFSSEIPAEGGCPSVAGPNEETSALVI